MAIPSTSPHTHRLKTTYQWHHCKEHQEELQENDLDSKRMGKRDKSRQFEFDKILENKSRDSRMKIMTEAVR